MIEKSASTHSDSSGFADLESAGEATHSNLDLQQVGLVSNVGKEQRMTKSVKNETSKISL